MSHNDEVVDLMRSEAKYRDERDELASALENALEYVSNAALRGSTYAARLEERISTLLAKVQP